LVYGVYVVNMKVILLMNKRTDWSHGPLVSSPDPTLEEGKGSGEFGHSPWARERKLSTPMRLSALAQSCDSPIAGMQSAIAGMPAI
jgi:hypothetical protein